MSGGTVRVLLSTFGSRGDVHPMFALARAFADLGHEVTACAPPDYAEDAAAAGVGFRSIGDPMATQLDSAVGIFARGRVASSFRKRWDEQVRNHFAVLDELAADVDLMVETSMSITGPTVAETAGIPFRYVALVPTAFPSRYHAPGFLPIESLPLGLNIGAARFVNAAISKVLGSAVTAERRRRRLHVGSAFGAWQSVFRHGTPVLAADQVLAPLPPDLVGRVLQTGAMRLRTGATLSHELEAFLAQGDPAVFVGFGSMPVSDRKELGEAVARALHATGRRGVVQGVAVHAGDKVFACGDEPHELLFPRCATIVHHGGAGTTFAAASAGMSQVVVPFMADQHYWGRRVATLGAGPTPVAVRSLARGLVGALESALSEECCVAARTLRDRLTHDGARLTARALIGTVRPGE